MSPFMFVITRTSNWAGSLAIWWAALSTMTWRASISG